MDNKQLLFEYDGWIYYSDFSLVGQQTGHFWKVENSMVYYQLYGIGTWDLDTIDIQKVYRKYIARSITDD